MKYPEDYFAFESKIQSIFKKSISALNEALDGSWQIRLNNQYRRASIETDIEIYRQLKYLCTANGIKSSTTSISVERSAIQHYR